MLEQLECDAFHSYCGTRQLSAAELTASIDLGGRPWQVSMDFNLQKTFVVIVILRA
jgi:hypothetical protein